MQKRELGKLYRTLARPKCSTIMHNNFILYKVKSLSLFKITFLSNLYQKKKDGDLDGLIQRYKIENKKLKIIEILFYLYQILSGLNHLHENNIVHRDLKPK